MCKHEILLAIIGGLFVLETFSVVIQVLIFKITGKRVFLMAPPFIIILKKRLGGVNNCYSFLDYYYCVSFNRPSNFKNKIKCILIYGLQKSGISIIELFEKKIDRIQTLG